MKRTIKVFCMFMILIVLLAGCAEKTEIVATNKVYDILRRGDQYSIRLKPNNGYRMGYERTGGGDLRMAVEIPSRYFTDLQSMKRAVLDGDFTPKELSYTTSVEENSKIDTDEALIFNPYQLYQPYVPEGSRILEKIQWRVWKYHFTLVSDRAATGGFAVLHEKEYVEHISKLDFEFTDIKEEAEKKANIKEVIIEELGETDTGEHQIIYTYIFKNGVQNTFKETRQIYETPEKTLFIVCKYNYKRSGDSKPHEIEVYGKENGGYFFVSFYTPKEIIDIQWLSQFGIKPFEGNEPPPKAIG